MALDSIGNIYCAGFSNSDFGEENAGASDAFILKLNSSGNVIWITQLGALTKKIGVLNANEGSDYCEAITVDKNDNVYCAGKTSGNLGEVNAGAHDAFVMKLNSSGDLIWISQLGVDTKVDGLAGANQGDDNCEGVSVDDNGNVYCAGETTGSLGDNYADNPSNFTQSDIFILKLK